MSDDTSLNIDDSFSDSSVEVSETSVSETVVTSVTENDVSSVNDSAVTLDTIHDDLQHISQGIDHIFVIGFLLIVFLGVWTVFNKWYFGGV